MSTLEQAIEIATEAHRGQRDKAGNDYIGHPLRVMAAGKTTEEKIVGVLHDVVEDSNWTLDRLAAEGFAPEIIEALRCLTHAEEEPYDRYIARIKGNLLAVAVKLNDLTDNMDIRRLPYLSDKDVKRLKRYLRAYKQLTGEPTYSVYACRQEYPNAYMPWTEEDDLELTRRWCEGATEVELSAHFQRKPVPSVRASRSSIWSGFTGNQTAMTELRKIPNVGPRTEADLLAMGYTTIESLKGKTAEELYAEECRLRRCQIDRCQLYLYRAVVYFVNTENPDPAKCKWWLWKDRPAAEADPERK